ncbi:hypothetical protein ACOI1H_16675 [Loktanella sp. DJP18]|uniref:hypothetical protein n=1 Tax=Loktanella sp. DJP18 TaxID=3409788 RepID=UPI003BB48F14
MNKLKLGFLALFSSTSIISATPLSAFFGPVCIPTLYNCMCTYIMPCPVTDSTQIGEIVKGIQDAQQKLEVLKSINNPKEMFMMAISGEGGIQIPGMSSIGIDINGIISGDLKGLGIPSGIDLNMIKSLASGDINANTFTALAGAAGVDMSALEQAGLTPATLDAIARGQLTPAMLIGPSGAMGITPGVAALHDSLSQIGIDNDMISAVATGRLSPAALMQMATSAGITGEQLNTLGLTPQNLGALAQGSMSMSDQLRLASGLGMQGNILSGIGIDQNLVQNIASGSDSIQSLISRANAAGLTTTDLAGIGLDADTLQRLGSGMSPSAVMGLMQRAGFDRSPLTALGINAELLGQIASGELPPDALNLLAANAGLSPSAIIIPGSTSTISMPSTSGRGSAGQDFITIPTSSVPGFDNVLNQARGGTSCSAGGSGSPTEISPSLGAYGFDDDYSKAASAIFGGESGGNWKISEQAGYSPARAREVFPSAFGEMNDSEIRAVTSQGDSAFFEKIYGPGSSAGGRLGNANAGDGYKFRGRSWLQLTGRDNYQRYAEITGHDIVSNPDLLITDSQVSADVTAAYLADRVDKTGDPVADVRAAVSGTRTGLGYTMNIDADRARFAALGGENPSEIASVYSGSCSATKQSGPFPVGTPPDMCKAENLTLISTDIAPNSYGDDLPNIDMAISGGDLQSFPEAITAVQQANIETAAFGFARSVTVQNIVVKAMMNIPAFEQMLDQTTTLKEDLTVYDTIQAQLMTARAETASMLTALVSMKAAKILGPDVLSPTPTFPQNSRFQEIIAQRITEPATAEAQISRETKLVAQDHSEFVRDTRNAVHNHNLINDAIAVADGMPVIAGIIDSHEALKLMQVSLEGTIKSRLEQLYIDPDAAWDILRLQLYTEAGLYLDSKKYDEGFADAKSLSQAVTAISARTAYGARKTYTVRDSDGNLVVMGSKASETPYAYDFIDAKGAPMDEPYAVKPRTTLVQRSGSDEDEYMPAGYEMVGAFQYYLELVRRTQFYAELRRGDTMTSMSSRFWIEMITNASKCMSGPLELNDDNLIKRPEMFDLAADCDHLTWSGGDEGDYISAVELGGADASLWTSKITLDRTQKRTGGPEKVMLDLAAAIAYAKEHDLLGRMEELNLTKTAQNVEKLLATLTGALTDTAFGTVIQLPNPAGR